jgi:hypothetical protein
MDIDKLKATAQTARDEKARLAALEVKRMQNEGNAQASRLINDMPRIMDEAAANGENEAFLLIYDEDSVVNASTVVALKEWAHRSGVALLFEPLLKLCARCQHGDVDHDRHPPVSASRVYVSWDEQLDMKNFRYIVE